VSTRLPVPIGGGGNCTGLELSVYKIPTSREAAPHSPT